MLYFNLVIGTLIFFATVGVATVFRIKSFPHVIALGALLTFAVLFGVDFFATSWRLDTWGALRYSAGIALFDAAIFLGINAVIGKRRKLAPKARHV